MNYLKNAPSNIWTFILRQSNVVIAILVCLCFFFFHKISNDTKHYEELHNLQMENLIISNELGQALDMVVQQGVHVNEVDEALENRTQQLSEAVSFINLLIKKLDSLGEWPLKENSSPKPGNPTKSEA